MSAFVRWLRLREGFTAAFKRDFWKTEDGRLTEQAEVVLNDLKKFCGADQSSLVVAKDGHIDTHATCYAEGKRAVLLRIQAYLNLTDEQLMKLRKEESDE